MLGRVWGAVLATAFAAAPVGIFATGWLAQNVGLSKTLGIFGGLHVMVICHLVMNRPLRGLARPADTATPFPRTRPRKRPRHADPPP